MAHMKQRIMLAVEAWFFVFEVIVVTREEFLLEFAALGQARKLACLRSAHLEKTPHSLQQWLQKQIITTPRLTNV